MKLISGGVCAASGFKASGIHCGIRRMHFLLPETLGEYASTGP